MKAQFDNILTPETKNVLFRREKRNADIRIIDRHSVRAQRGKYAREVREK